MVSVGIEELRKAVLASMEADAGSSAKLREVCDVLRNAGKSFDWAGYYLVDRTVGNELVLGPFSGQPTEHTRIGFGRGICGQAASTLKVFVVDDVSAESNYLSCSPSVRSEFVAPVICNGVLVGELDIDSNKARAFGREDAEFLQWVASVTAKEVAEAAGFDV